MKRASLNTLVVCVGILVLWQTTKGFTSFTSEQLRRLEVRASPVELPDVPLRDERGQALSMRDYRGRILLVDFIFTSCAGLCPQMTSGMRALHQRTEDAQLQDDVSLLSVSFDPARDTPQRLRAYGERFGADFSRWKFAYAKRPDLRPLLDAAGVVVIPQSDGQFQHNAAVHVIDRQGRLADIQNYDKPDAIMKAINKLLGAPMNEPLAGMR